MTKELVQQPAMRFIGHAYPEAHASEDGSFVNEWQNWMDEDAFAPLDALAADQQQGSLIVFSPYGSMVYWIGRLVPAGTPAPQGYQYFDLPEGTAATLTKPSGMMMTNYPVEMAIKQGATALDMAGFALPEYIGQTQTPYYLETYQLVDDVIKTVTYTVYEGDDRDFGYDDVD